MLKKYSFCKLRELPSWTAKHHFYGKSEVLWLVGGQDRNTNALCIQLLQARRQGDMVANPILASNWLHLVDPFLSLTYMLQLQEGPVLGCQAERQREEKFSSLRWIGTHYLEIKIAYCCALHWPIIIRVNICDLCSQNTSQLIQGLNPTGSCALSLVTFYHKFIENP